MKPYQKALAVGVAVFLGVFAAGVAYPYIQQKQANQPAATQTADWKTYINNQYGFEIKYPSALNVTNASGQVDKFYIGDAVMPLYGISVKQNVASLDELKSLMGEPIAFQMSKINGANSEINLKDTTVSGEKAIEMSYENFAGGYTGITHQVGVIKGTTAYIINLINGSETEYYQMLSTFKFTK